MDPETSSGRRIFLISMVKMHISLMLWLRALIHYPLLQNDEVWNKFVL